MKPQTKFKKTEIGVIPKDWEIKPLGELFNISAGGDLSKLTFSKEKTKDFKYPIYSNSLNKKGLYGFSKTYQYEPECVTITGRGEVGKAEYRKEPFNAIVRLLVLKPKNEISCYFVSSFINSKLDFSHVGSAVNQLTAPSISGFSVAFPPLPEQKAIANILSTLDEKIELLQKQNKTLEEIGQAIFKKWFVDNPEKEDWKEGKLGYILEALESGRRPRGGINPYLKEGVPSIGAENINGLGYYNYSNTKFIDKEFYDNMKTGKVKSEDVLLYKDGAKIGRKTLFMKGFPFQECCVNEHVFILRSKEYFNQFYLYLWLDQNFMTERIKNLNSNAAQPGINQTGVLSLPILIPDKEALEKFDLIIRPLFTKIFSNCFNIQTLSQIRDSLLPKLMSGKIRVPLEEKNNVQ